MMGGAADLVTVGAIVVFLCQQAKRWVPGSWLPLVALLLGVAVQVGNDLALGAVEPSVPGLWGSMLVGAGVGMAAAGTYDLATAGVTPATEAATAADPAAGAESGPRDYPGECVGVCDSYAEAAGYEPRHRSTVGGLDD